MISVDVLKSYFFLLFPTKCPGEGIPGTIIDAYAAGLPVVSSLYPNFAEIIDEGVTGLGYEFDNVDAFDDGFQGFPVVLPVDGLAQ